MTNLLIIENQFLQFQEIRQQLLAIKESGRQKYTVFPYESVGKTDLTNYKVFMDLVRIGLNTRYDNTIRESALSGVLRIFGDANIDLVLIDFKLVGFYGAENGVDLANTLRSAAFEKPILFLSQTSTDDAEVVRLLRDPFLKPFDWVSKGYNNHELLEPNYVVDRVEPKIRALLADTNLLEPTRARLIGIAGSPMMNGVEGLNPRFFQENGGKIKSFTDDEIQEIEDFWKNIMFHTAERRKEFVSYYRLLIQNNIKPKS